MYVFCMLAIKNKGVLVDLLAFVHMRSSSLSLSAIEISRVKQWHITSLVGDMSENKQNKYDV